MSEKKSPEIKAEIRELADKIKITIDPKTGLATVAEDVFETSLPEGLTPESVKAVHNHNITFAAAVGLALGESSVPVMKKNSELGQTKLEILDSARNKFSFTFDRVKEVSGGAGTSERVEKIGQLGVKIDLRAARKTGQLGAVRTHLSELATKALAKK